MKDPRAEARGEATSPTAHEVEAAAAGWWEGMVHLGRPRLCQFRRRSQVHMQLLQSREAWVVYVAVHELGDPRIADARLAGDGLPFALATFEQLPNVRIK